MNNHWNAQPPVLFFDRGCPFAHRVLALLEHLNVRVDLRDSPVGHKPDGLARYYASRPLPLLAHAGLALTESRVMLEHLAEFGEFAEAYPENLVARTQHRHAMAVVDTVLTPHLFTKTTANNVDLRVLDALRILESAVVATKPEPCLLALHVAPIWRFLRLWQPSGAIVQAIEDHAPLHQWLEAVSDLDCITRTAHDPATLRQDLAKAREAGLLAPDAS